MGEHRAPESPREYCLLPADRGSQSGAVPVLLIRQSQLNARAAHLKSGLAIRQWIPDKSSVNLESAAYALKNKELAIEMSWDALV